MIYPNNEFKGQWDGFVMLILFFTCMVTPYRLAFAKEDPPAWTIVNTIIDIFFAVDIILSFMTAYYTEEFVLVEDRCKIAQNYMLGWFMIDLMAIMPFEKILSMVRGSDASNSSSNVNDMIRLARLGRLYKIIRLLRLLRILKLGKSTQNFLKEIKEFLKVSPGLSRLSIAILVFSMICHLVACSWIILAQFDEGNNNSWMTDEYKVMPPSE